MGAKGIPIDVITRDQIDRVKVDSSYTGQWPNAALWAACCCCLWNVDGLGHLTGGHTASTRLVRAAVVRMVLSDGERATLERAVTRLRDWGTPAEADALARLMAPSCGRP